jgi:hypothetical protein
MGKFADSLVPGEKATVMADPPIHTLRDEPTTIAAQGMRSTKLKEIEAKEEKVKEEPYRVPKSGVVGLREDFVESPEKVAQDKKDAEVQAKQFAQESAEQEKAKKEAHPEAAKTAHPAPPPAQPVKR